jgi:hypothetical protein
MFFKKEETIIRSDQDGFKVTRRNEILSAMTWNSIQQVIAFKRDAYAVDLICFAISDGNWSTEVNEELDGWKDLLAGLERLPGFPSSEDWFMKVALPPFAKNITILYERR